jgi:hypothetical protein
VEYHEVCSIFPPMTPEEYQALVQDIKANGLIESIKTWRGKVIDGRSRLQACQELGIKPRFQEWDGKGSLLQYVIGLNVHRRHLTAGQKAALAVNLLPLLEDEAKNRERLGREKFPHPEELARARDKAAELVGVNPHYVSDFKRIKEDSPYVAEQITRGELTISEAKEDFDWELVKVLRRSRERNGEFLPVLVNKQGWVIDGRHRLAAYKDWKREVLDLDMIHSMAARLVANIRDDSNEHRTEICEELAKFLGKHEPGDTSYTVASGKTIAERIEEETDIPLKEVVRWLDPIYLHPREQQIKQT